jgi:hypothetical protein
MAGPDFDSIKHLNPYNVEYWEARELMPLLGYGNKWQNFVDVIKKAMISCETTGNIVTDHYGICAGQSRAMLTCRAMQRQANWHGLRPLQVTLHSTASPLSQNRMRIT